MKLTTSKKLEYKVKWAGISLTRTRQMIVQMKESKPLVELIAELDGIEWARTSGPDGQMDKKISGMMRIVSAARTDSNDILIVLEKDGDGELTAELISPDEQKEGASE